jgi:hypothetical protein
LHKQVISFSNSLDAKHATPTRQVPGGITPRSAFRLSFSLYLWLA